MQILFFLGIAQSHGRTCKLETYRFRYLVHSLIRNLWYDFVQHYLAHLRTEYFFQLDIFDNAESIVEFPSRGPEPFCNSQFLSSLIHNKKPPSLFYPEKHRKTLFVALYGIITTIRFINLNTKPKSQPFCAVCTLVSILQS